MELWPKKETVIDREQGTIRWGDKVIRYDHIVDGDYEIPNLPEIVVGEGSPIANMNTTAATISWA